ncbi:MAG: hypothetical protein U0892_11170 [Pirellulales bacterium]
MAEVRILQNVKRPVERPAEREFDRPAARWRRVWRIAILLIIVAGCRGKDTIRRKSVDDLYREAVQAAAVRAPVVQSQFPPVAIEARPAMLDNAEPIPPIPAVNSPATVLPATPFQQNAQAQPPHIDPTVPVIQQVQWTQEQPPLQNGNGGEVAPASATVIGRPTIRSARYQEDEGGPLVTEHRDDEEVRELLRSLSELTQVPIVMDELVGGNATLHCDNEPLEQALKRVLVPLGLYYVKHGDEYYVAPADPNAALFQHISVRTQFRPQYHEIAVLAPMLPLRYKPFLHISNDRNMVMIEAPKPLAEEVVRCLEELDTPMQQVELEAIVCVTAPDSTFRFGFDWNHVVKVNSADSLNVGMSGLAMTASGSRSGMDQAFSNFAVTSAFVRLLAQEGYITIRAAPRVTAKDGEKASISISRETFFSLQPSSSNLLFRQDVQKVEAGIMLEIIPHVHDNTIGVQILRAEVSEDIRSLDASSTLGSNTYPIINRRQVTTEVDVQDGNTIVIGGLVQRQTVDRSNKIPGLSKFPVVGKMFQTIEKQEQEAEVAIFISPRIVASQDCRKL